MGREMDWRDGKKFMSAEDIRKRAKSFKSKDQLEREELAKAEVKRKAKLERERKIELERLRRLSLFSEIKGWGEFE